MDIKQIITDIHRNIFQSNQSIDIEYLEGFNLDQKKIKQNKIQIFINHNYFFHIQDNVIVHNQKGTLKFEAYLYRFVDEQSIQMLQEFIHKNQQQIKKQKATYKTEIKIIDKKEVIQVPFQPTQLHYVRYMDKVNNPSTDYNQEHLIEFFGEMNHENLHFGVLQQPNHDQYYNQQDQHILTKFYKNQFHSYSFEDSNEEFHLKQYYFRVWRVCKEFIYDKGQKKEQSAAYNQDGSLGLIPNKKIKIQLKINNESKPQNLEYWNKFNQSFSKSDFEHLKSGRWISSTAIDAYAFYLETEQEKKFKQRLENNTPAKLYTIIKSTFYVNIAGSGTDELIENQYFPKCKYGLGLENIYSRTFIIINKNSTHWYLIELQFKDDQPLFYVYDSMQRDTQGYQKEVIDIWRVLTERGLVLKYYKQPQVEIILTPQQRDGFSCGDHTVVKLRLAFEEKSFEQPLYDKYLLEMRDIMKQTINYQ